MTRLTGTRILSEVMVECSSEVGVSWWLFLLQDKMLDVTVGRLKDLGLPFGQSSIWPASLTKPDDDVFRSRS
jgi:hypothetical protein